MIFEPWAGWAHSLACALKRIRMNSDRNLTSCLQNKDSRVCTLKAIIHIWYVVMLCDVRDVVICGHNYGHFGHSTFIGISGNVFDLPVLPWCCAAWSISRHVLWAVSYELAWYASNPQCYWILHNMFRMLCYWFPVPLLRMSHAS